MCGWEWKREREREREKERKKERERERKRGGHRIIYPFSFLGFVCVHLFGFFWLGQTDEQRPTGSISNIYIFIYIFYHCWVLLFLSLFSLFSFHSVFFSLLFVDWCLRLWRRWWPSWSELQLWFVFFWFFFCEFRFGSFWRDEKKEKNNFSR